MTFWKVFSNLCAKIGKKAKFCRFGQQGLCDSCGHVACGRGQRGLSCPYPSFHRSHRNSESLKSVGTIFNSILDTKIADSASLI